MSNRIVAVVGATGNQGGSVVSALLKHGGYAVRGVTRNKDGPAAKALQEKGVEVVSADTSNKDSLIKAFEGAYAVFGVTVAFTAVSEELQGCNIVDAAKAAKVPLLIWSSLPGGAESSNGKYTNLIHLDQKAAVDKYIATTGQPAVIVKMGVFAETLINYKQILPDPVDPTKWIMSYPRNLRTDTQWPGIWVAADFGNIVVAVIDRWSDEAYRGRLTKGPIYAAPFVNSVDEMLGTFRKVTGKEWSFVGRDANNEIESGMYSFRNDGFYSCPSQSEILEELAQLGVLKTHTFEDFVREAVVPYVQSKQ